MFTYKYKKQRAAFEEENPGELAMAWPIDHTVSWLHLSLIHI